MIELTLPYPPSVNRYWRSARAGKGIKVYISEQGQQFRTAVHAAVLQARANKVLAGRLTVQVELYPADNRKRDIDNVCKSLLDSLAHAGVYLDDSQIDKLTLIRQGNIKGGKCIVQIGEHHDQL